MRFATKPIRVGQELDSDHRAVIQPLYQSATFGWASLNDVPKIDYTRCQNPNRLSLEQVIAALENGKHCTAFASGMAAIMGALSLLEAGDHLLMASDIYGGTFRLADKLLPKYGIEVTDISMKDPASIAQYAKENTKMIIFEAPTNPNLRLMDIKAIAEQAKKLGVLTVFDNTFASPYLQNPLDLGIDIVVHSTTKYISGHSDVIGGAVVTNNDDVQNALIEYSKTVGSVPSPFDCWLTLRGLKTLSVRMKQHCENALAVAQYLEGHPKVSKVYYPGLESHPDYELAKKQMTGFGGMVTFEVNGTGEDACTFAEGCNVFLLAESLGGVESLIGYPPLMSHATMTEEQRLAKGIPPTLIRLSVGIEDKDDLIEDIEQALAKIPARATASV
ncbi:MAG: cystathionine gamma-synthase [Armatimonadetes bacterium 55-13]|nr:PLP-dependent transferase [Armatimonadota bacterium]OJU62917.1 MAG: cystathionine gamma-synthase [Armatimonadetes bacterium 55-13]